MKQIFFLLSSFLIMNVSFAQVSPVLLSNPRLDTKGASAIDPMTGKPQAGVPKLYNLTFFVSNPDSLQMLTIKFNSDSAKDGDVVKFEAHISKEQGGTKITCGKFSGMVMPVPFFTKPGEPPVFRKMVNIPLELTDPQSSSWKVISIEGFDISFKMIRLVQIKK
jgi:hypothetical protein